MVGERSVPNPVRTVAMSRRVFLGGVGASISTGVAGCLGDDSRGEVVESLEATTAHLEDAGTSFDELGPHLDNEDWESCLSSVGPIREDLSAAEEDANEARSLAEEEGHSDLADAATAALELIDVLNGMTDEVEGLCTAASNGNFDEADGHLENLDELEQQRVQRQREFENAMEALDG